MAKAQYDRVRSSPAFGRYKSEVPLSQLENTNSGVFWIASSNHGIARKNQKSEQQITGECDRDRSRAQNDNTGKGEGLLLDHAWWLQAQPWREIPGMSYQEKTEMRFENNSTN